MTWKLPNRIVPDEWIYIMFISRKWKEYTVVAAVHHQHFALNAHNRLDAGMKKRFLWFRKANARAGSSSTLALSFLPFHLSR
jgi:hypothetical protein